MDDGAHIIFTEDRPYLEYGGLPLRVETSNISRRCILSPIARAANCDSADCPGIPREEWARQMRFDVHVDRAVRRASHGHRYALGIGLTGCVIGIVVGPDLEQTRLAAAVGMLALAGSSRCSRGPR
jgi:hypothetical protein